MVYTIQIDRNCARSLSLTVKARTPLWGGPDLITTRDDYETSYGVPHRRKGGFMESTGKLCRYQRTGVDYVSGKKRN